MVVSPRQTGDRSNRGQCLDLGWGASLTGDVARDYDRLCTQLRTGFVQFLSQVSEPFADDIDWWLEGPASRNHILSPLFHQCVALCLLREYLEQDVPLTRVLVDSPGERRIVRHLVNRARSQPIVVFRQPPLSRLLTRIRSMLSPFRSMARLLWDWLKIRYIAGSASPGDCPAGAILVDTFAIPGHVEEDRYYPGLVANLNEGLQPRLRLVPQFFDFQPRALSKAASWLGQHRDRYLLKERYLSFADMLWSFAHWYRVRRLPVGPANFRGIELGPLIRQELGSSRGFRCAVRGLMNYRFAAAVSRHGISPACVVDWFENHPMDRGWNAGWRHFHRRSPPRIIGYQGFFAAFPAARPTPCERRAGLVPDCVYVTGDGFRSEVREFDPELRTAVAPAFRYAWLADYPITGDEPDGARVLVALPYDRQSASRILDAVVGCAARSEFQFLVKPHPILPLAALRSEPIGERVREVSGALRDWFPKVAVVVSGGMATSSLEALVCGRPVVVFAAPGRRHEIAMPSAVPAHWWTVCEDAAHLDQALTRLRRRADVRASQTMALRQLLFSPVDPDAVTAFLGVGESTI